MLACPNRNSSLKKYTFHWTSIWKLLHVNFIPQKIHFKYAKIWGAPERCYVKLLTQKMLFKHSKIRANPYRVLKTVNGLKLTLMI